MTRPTPDSMVRTCLPCDIMWKGSFPCWCCGAEGTKGGAALAAHFTTSGAANWRPPQAPVAGVSTPPATVPTMCYDPQIGNGP